MPDTQELAARTRAFITEQVLPVEREMVVDGRPMDDALRLELQKAAKAAGVFGPLSSPEYGGLGLDMRGVATVMEAAGASLIGPFAVHCSAPDDGNIHLLASAATPEQARRYLAPLASGEVRSAIAMTEPAPGAGADPSMLLTVAEKVGDGWVINGSKHFTTGADGAAFIICVAAGHHIARRGMQPIHDVTRTARETGPGNLAQRITTAGRPAELHELAGTFNAMLNRLEGAFDRLSQFSADIAHELRTPVNNLRGELDVALQKPRSPAEYQELIGSALEECGRLARIIDSLLFLARSENPQTQVELEQFDVAAELRHIREFYEATAQEAGVELLAEPTGPLETRLNRALFQRAVGNLITNAIAHTPRGGKVMLRAKGDSESLAIEVADTGAGIPSEHLPRVFDRFYRADHSRRSAGGGVGNRQR